MRVFWKILAGIEKLELQLQQMSTKERAAFEATDDETWMDNQEVIDYLKISRSTFFKLKREGIIKGRKMGKRE